MNLQAQCVRRRDHRGVQPMGVADVGRVDREAVLLAAVDCLVRLGDHGLSATHIAAEAGTDVQCVREYFPSAPALAEAVVDRIVDDMLQTLNDAIPPDDRLRLHLTSLAQMGEERPALFLVLSQLELRARRDGLIRAALARSTRAWRARLEELFREGVTSGVFSPDLDVEAAVDLVIAAAVGTSPRSGPSSRRLAQLEGLLLPNTT